MQLNNSTRSLIVSSTAAGVIFIVISLLTGSTFAGAVIGAVIVTIIAAVIGLAFRAAKNKNLRS